MGIWRQFVKPTGFTGRMLVRMMNHGHSGITKWTLDMADIRSPRRILDIGCGGGGAIRSMLKRYPDARISGADYSADCIETAADINKAYSKRTDFTRASVEALPFKDDTYDLATAFETIYFWPDIVKSFEEVKRVLKPGGFFVIGCEMGSPEQNEFYRKKIPGMKLYTADRVTALLSQAGYKDISVKTKKGGSIYMAKGRKPEN